MIGKIRRAIWEEIRPDLIKLDCAPLKLFAIPKIHFPRQPTSWIIYNFLLTIYWNFWFVLALFYWGWKPWYPRGTDSQLKYFIFGSDWAYMTACFYFIIRFITIVVYQWRRGFKVTSLNHEELDKADPIPPRKQKCGKQKSKKSKKKAKPEGIPDNLKLPWYVKVGWFLQLHMYCGLLITTVTRWAIDSGEPYQYSYNIIDLHHHGIGIVLLTIDLLLIASPLRFQHIVWPPIGAALYIIFTVIYYFAGGTNPHHLYKDINGDTYIYLNYLDWGTIPGKSVIHSVMIVFCGFPAMYFMYYLLQKLRDTCVEWYYFKKQNGHH